MLILRLFIGFLSGYVIDAISHIYMEYLNNNDNITNIHFIKELYHITKRKLFLSSSHMIFSCICFLLLCCNYECKLWQIPVVFCFCASLLMIAYIDMKTMLIPNQLLYVLSLFGIVFFFQPLACSLEQRFFGAAAVSGFMSLVNLLHHDSFGLGDIKLMLICGFLLGVNCVLVAMLLAILCGGCYGICLLLANKTKAHSHIAFAPFLCSALILSLLFANELISAYMALLYHL